MKNMLNGLLLTLSAACCSATAAIQPASIPMEPVSVTPTIGLQTGYDDNIFRDTDNEVDSIITIISPAIEITAEDGLNAYRAQYQFTKGNYADSSADNYQDHKLSLDAHLEFSARSKLDLNTAYSKNHEARGTGISETGGAAENVTSPLEYDLKSLSAQYAYGANDAKGRIVLAGKYLDRTYQNFRAITDERDAEEVTSSATFYYRVMPKTSLLFELRNQDIDYDIDPVSSLDSNTWRYYVGATWEGTAKTTGTIKLGHVSKDFSSDTRDDFSGSSWEATVRWSPRTYSNVELTTSQSEKESTGDGDFIDSKAVRIDWKHSWNSRFDTTVGAGFTADEYKGDPDGREDDISEAGIRLNYDMKRWLSFGLSYNYQDTDSNATGITFDRNLYMLSVNASL